MGYLVDSDFTVFADQNYEYVSDGSSFPEDFFFYLDGPTVDGSVVPVTLTNYGTIGATTSITGDVIIGLASGDNPASFDNFGTLHVTATVSAMTAVGVEGPDTINEASGSIIVQGNRAIGLELNGGGAPIINHGHIEVDGGTDVTIGISALQNVQDVLLNTGTISVHATDGSQAVGIESELGSFGMLINTGTISVTGDTNGDQTVGIACAPFMAPVIDNQGDIRAGIAIQQFAQSGNGWETSYIHNSGTIEGRLNLYEYNNAATSYYVTNTGTITGDVYLGVDYYSGTDASGERSIFDGRGGTLHGNIYGGDGNDTIFAGAGDNVVSGGRGDDVLSGGAGNDTLNGGDGSDTATYLDATSAVHVALVTTAQSVGGGAGTDTFVSIENLEGSNYNDTLTGDAGNNVLTGAGGNDSLNGGGGSDTASYHDATGGVTVNLTIAGAQNVGGGAGFDTLNSIENLEGSAFADHLIGNSGDNILSGLAGDDLLAGGAGNDVLNGGDGLDTVDYSGATGAITVDLGNSAPQAIGGGQGSDTLSSIEGVIGSSYNDSLKGDANDNVLRGGPGDDTLDGQGGNDTASYSDATGGVTVDLNVSGPQAIGHGVGTDTLISIENLTGSDYADTLIGNASNNVLDGGKGNDTLSGGDGSDIASYADATGGVTVDLNIASAQNVGGGDGVDTLTSIEGIQGSNFADTLTASTAAVNTLNGGGGDDTLIAIFNNDRLDGGDGNDTVDYSSAANRIFADMHFEGSNATTVSIIGVGSEYLTSVENIIGTAFNDTITGNASDNYINGGAGNDQIDMSYGGVDRVDGGYGDDTIAFGAAFTAADKIDGGAGTDTLALAGDYSAGVTFLAATMKNVEQISLAAGYSYNLVLNNANVAAGQTLTVDASALGAANALIFDGSHETDGNFVLIGGAGNDKLDSGNGNDTLDLSGGGNDTALGGSGNDTIVAGAALTAADKIDGGDGADTVTLNGDYSAGLSFGPSTMINVETLLLTAGHSYKLTMNNANVGAGQTLTVDASALGASNTLNFNGSLETDGSFAITGGAGNDVLKDGAGNDVLSGGAGNDSFTLCGGNDTVSGGDGNDTINFGATLTAADRIDGGAGTDTVNLTGDYSAGLTFGAATMVNVETLKLGAGFSYKFTSTDATVAAGQSLKIDGSALGAANSLIFNGAAETDGHFSIIGGAGHDVVTGGAGNDSFTLSSGGTDTANGGAGDDIFIFGSSFDATDIVNGGSGTDILKLDGDYSAGIVFGNATMQGIEGLSLAAGHSYNLTLANANVAAGATLTVYGSSLSATDTLTFDGSHESDGNFVVQGGAGNDVLTGGAGNDTIAGGAGNDTITGGRGADLITPGNGADIVVYTSAAQSTGAAYDTVSGFNATATDKFDFAFTVAAVDTAVTHGALSTASFDTDLAAAVGAGQLGVHHAMLYTPDSGTLAGQTFLIVDANGVAGYQAGADFAIHLDHLSGTIDVTDFI
ncbi:MAG TPA: calcium-binding protein [Rhizomicrobium sp.]|nr:calcium-binding protein [Rhizomicrobium sp.]